MLLKYKIFEYCLEALFEKVKINFSDCKIQGCRIGEHFTRIDYYMNGKIWRSHYNCRILDLTESITAFSFTTTYAHAVQSTYSGEAITAYSLEFLEFIK